MTPKQQAFIEHYLANPNATQAALAAGYSTRTAGSIGQENLTKPEIQAAIKARLTVLKLEADDVLKLLAEHARGTMADFVKVGDDGEPWIDFRQAAAKNRLHLVKRFKVKKKRGEGWNETEIEVELYDAQRAAELIGRHWGLFPNKVEVDWKRELADAGLDPEQEVERLTNEFVRHMQPKDTALNGDGSGARGAGAGSVDAGQGAAGDTASGAGAAAPLRPARKSARGAKPQRR